MLPKLHFTIERWKFNKDFKMYVSTLGRVKDENKKIIRPKVNRQGYYIIIHNRKLITLHRLVLSTFKPNKEAATLTIDHIDSNKRNCELKNLEWCTRDENLRRAAENYIEVEIEKAPVKNIQPKNNTKKKPVKTHTVMKKYVNAKGIDFKNCKEAAQWLAQEYELPKDDKSIQNLSSRIGEAVSHNGKVMGISFSRHLVELEVPCK